MTFKKVEFFLFCVFVIILSKLVMQVPLPLLREGSKELEMDHGSSACLHI